MKAVVFTEYGPPDVLRIEDVEKPAPQDNEVLIKIRASTVTPTDCFFRKGDPFITRFFVGLLKPRLNVPGVELAGEIEAVGKKVESFKTGDHVFASAGTGCGAA